MPRSDADKKSEAANAAQRKRYAEDAEFRERKLATRQANRDSKSNQEAVKKWRKAHPKEYRAYNRERMRKARAAKKAAAEV